MKRIISIVGITICLNFIAIQAFFSTGCSGVQSVSATGGYTPATGEITVGVSIEFKAMPPDSVSAALVASGATGGPLLWSFDTVATDARRNALVLALAHGAELPGKAKR